MYDVALQDLEELENELLLIHSPFMWRNGIKLERQHLDGTCRSGRSTDGFVEILERKVQVQSEKRCSGYNCTLL